MTASVYTCDWLLSLFIRIGFISKASENGAVWMNSLLFPPKWCLFISVLVVWVNQLWQWMRVEWNKYIIFSLENHFSWFVEWWSLEYQLVLPPRCNQSFDVSSIWLLYEQYFHLFLLCKACLISPNL